MGNNIGKIFSIEIKEGVIVSIRVYISDLEKYKDLNGYKAPQTSYKIAEFNGDEAIYTILRDIGFNRNIDLKINKKDYEAYVLLSNYVSDDSRIMIDGSLFMSPSRKLKAIKKITLSEKESIHIIKIEAGDGYGVVNVEYVEYILMYAIWGKYLPEEILQENLKKNHTVETYNNEVYNYYRRHEDKCNKIVRRIMNTSNITWSGVFLVNIEDSLLKITAIEESTNITYKEILPKGTVFYISNCAIAYMQ